MYFFHDILISVSQFSKLIICPENKIVKKKAFILCRWLTIRIKNVIINKGESRNTF